MKIAAVISEYNPFHNGHKYQVDTIKKEFDAIVAIMSGNFVQRGDIALTDKWTRADMALKNGIDLVLELPVISALNSAELFARGGVFVADKTGVIDSLFFGSECGDIDLLKKTAEMILNEPEMIKQKIKENLKCGMSYPTAVKNAWAGKIDTSVIENPNNILAVEYIKALMKYKSSIKPRTVKRIGAGYNESGYDGIFQSATGIRERIKNGENTEAYTPKNVHDILKNAVKFSNDDLTALLRYKVLSVPEKIKEINDVSEGLENRIYEAVKIGGNFEDIAGYIKSKRYTMARIKRILISIILDLDKDIMGKEPDYIRVLGMNKKGMEILKMMRKSAKLPIVVKTADFSSDILNKDILASDIAALSKNPYAAWGKDFKKSPIIYNE